MAEDGTSRIEDNRHLSWKPGAQPSRVDGAGGAMPMLSASDGHKALEGRIRHGTGKRDDR